MDLNQILASEEYAYYLHKFAEAQVIDDRFNDRYGFPRKNLALLHVQHRIEERAQLHLDISRMFQEALTNRAT